MSCRREGPWSEWAVPGSALGCACPPSRVQAQAPILSPEWDGGEAGEPEWVIAQHQGHSSQELALRESCGCVRATCPGVTGRNRALPGGGGWGPRVSSGVEE